MASPTDPLVRALGGKSKSAVVAEPIDHLIQHFKQADPLLYEALKRLSYFVNNVTSMVETIPPPPPTPTEADGIISYD